MLAEASFGLRIYGVNSDCNISGFVFFKKSPKKWKRCQLNPWMQWVPSFCIQNIFIKDRRRLYWISGSVRSPPLFSWNNNENVANKCIPLQGIMAILSYTVWMVQFLIAVLQPDEAVEVESVTHVVSTLPLSKIMSWYDLLRQYQVNSFFIQYIFPYCW